MYGLRQSIGLFHDTLESWLVNYGFQLVNKDCTRAIFKLMILGPEQILLSLSRFVDDGLCASNSEALYQTFLTDLQQKFNLSYQGNLSFYLGVTVDHSLHTGVKTLSQEQFVQTLLESFNMVRCKPVSTQAEPNSHLVKGDQSQTPDKAVV